VWRKDKCMVWSKRQNHNRYLKRLQSHWLLDIVGHFKILTSLSMLLASIVSSLFLSNTTKMYTGAGRSSYWDINVHRRVYSSGCNTTILESTIRYANFLYCLPRVINHESSTRVLILALASYHMEIKMNPFVFEILYL